MKVKAVPAITFYLSLMLTILVLLFGNEPNKSQYILVIATITVFYIAYITNKITSPASLSRYVIFCVFRLWPFYYLCLQTMIMGLPIGLLKDIWMTM